MSMPYHFVLVRHGESEANVIRSIAEAGDDSVYTAEFLHRQDHQFRLSETGVQQAAAAGEWIKRHVLEAFGLPYFERSYCSPYVRSMETAGHMQLPERDGWRLEYLARERDYGDIEGLTRNQFKERYELSAHKYTIDPLFWRPPGGESVAEMTETRVRELYHTLHREAADKSAIVVSHMIFLLANRFALEQPTPRDWVEWVRKPVNKIDNCQVMHYSRINPETGEISPYIRWIRSVCPWEAGVAAPGEWREFSRPKYSNADLLTYAQAISRLNERDEAHT